jgi:subtilisin family serine protease
LKKTIFIIIVLFYCACFSYGQVRKGDFRLQKGSNSHELYVCFKPDKVKRHIDFTVAEIKSLQSKYKLSFENGIGIPVEKLDEMERNAIKLTGSGESVSRLRNIFIVKIDNPSNEKLFSLANELEKINAVAYCFLISMEPIQPPGDIPPTTPNYEGNQAYIQANPGINMQYAWNLGLTGTGIKIKDVEYGFNDNHEELNHKNVLIHPGMTISSSASVSYTEHGTSVFGIVYADKGNYGVSGLAYGATEMRLFPEWQQSGYDRVNAVAQAIGNSVIGDVILYEIQTYGGTNNYFVPAEYDALIWDLTKAATDAGLTIVAAAGNGNNINIGEDLDTSAYALYMARGDSGAIIVGAGSPNIAHNKLEFSTYGSRVDVQGWGQSVVTAGKGDVVKIGGDFNQGYTYFGGTSSATSIVASCAAVLQSYYYALTGNYMTGIQMRTLLKTTGIPQGTGGNIGPLPNMRAAILKIQNDFLSVGGHGVLEFIAYPNPVDNILTIKTKELSSGAKAEVHNSLGQLVYTSKITDESTIDLSSFSKGLYFVKVSDNGKSEVKKIIKR